MRFLLTLLVFYETYAASVTVTDSATRTSVISTCTPTVLATTAPAQTPHTSQYKITHPLKGTTDGRKFAHVASPLSREGTLKAHRSSHYAALVKPQKGRRWLTNSQQVLGGTVLVTALAAAAIEAYRRGIFRSSRRKKSKKHFSELPFADKSFSDPQNVVHSEVAPIAHPISPKERQDSKSVKSASIPREEREGTTQPLPLSKPRQQEEESPEPENMQRDKGSLSQAVVNPPTVAMDTNHTDQTESSTPEKNERQSNKRRCPKDDEQSYDNERERTQEALQPNGGFHQSPNQRTISASPDHNTTLNSKEVFPTASTSADTTSDSDDARPRRKRRLKGGGSTGERIASFSAGLPGTYGHSFHQNGNVKLKFAAITPNNDDTDEDHSDHNEEEKN